MSLSKYNHLAVDSQQAIDSQQKEIEDLQKTVEELKKK